MLYDVTIDGKNYRLELNRAEGRWSCRLDGRELEVDAVLARPDVLSLRIGNNAYEIKSERVANDLHLWVGSTRFAAEVRDPRSLRSRTRAGDDQGPKKIVAPMPGKVVRLLVREGAEVELGAGVAVVELASAGLARQPAQFGLFRAARRVRAGPFAPSTPRSWPPPRLGRMNPISCRNTLQRRLRQ